MRQAGTRLRYRFGWRDSSPPRGKPYIFLNSIIDTACSFVGFCLVGFGLGCACCSFVKTCSRDPFIASTVGGSCKGSEAEPPTVFPHKACRAFETVPLPGRRKGTRSFHPRFWMARGATHSFQASLEVAPRCLADGSWELYCGLWALK